MAKKIRIHRNRNPKIAAGATYRVTNKAEVADVDGDKAMDLVLSHSTTRNGQLFYQSECVWYGIDASTAQLFVSKLDDVLVENLPIPTFGQLVKHWKTLSRTMNQITDLGAEMASSIGEPA